MKMLFSPHYRLIYAFLFSITISSIQSVNLLLILTACMAACVAACVVFLHSHQPKHLLKRWLKLNLFSLLIWLTLSWRIEPHGIVLNPLGITQATLISLRMNFIVLSIWLLLHHITDTLLVQAIAKLPLPKKLIHLFVLSIRYISLLGELNDKMEMAMKARGFQPHCNRFTLKVYAQRVALLLIHAMVKAEKAEQAMKARGFNI
ncbi:energy-coupling factor transporter transmembrane protein EcfT [Haemophilus sputorum]|uniref:Energy-coupling factor transporter transmembrane protein EcfT n=1 Tax=Haemophilus sputorum TaxID=1078480 RepID=A0A369YDB3_9PAST|nr:energy-coupling factor transporter transmembrane component T [Haemophilus sputorum]RDE72762.1 energy-coupling factor transporter transmembrane protein EcfT [Haemophilus sputorum]